MSRNRAFGVLSIFVVASVSFCLSATSVTAAADPLINDQWGLLAIGAPQVWNQSTGVGVTVAIIDGGSGPHPDLDSNLEPGRSIIAGVESTGATDVDSDDGHGTHVAGIVAAIANNGIGVSGVAPNARILPYRVLDSDGHGNGDDVVIAIRLAVENGVKVINLSLGSTTENPSLTRAIQYAVDHNVLVVAAAGNFGENATPRWPAADDNTLAVTAIDQNLNVASFGQRGDYIDLSAPGVNILSTKTSKFSCGSGAEPVGYGCISGTSMAAPFVSGAAALLFSAHPGITAAQVRTLLISSATDLGPAGRDTTFGAGLIYLPAAFAALEVMFPTVFNPIITAIGRVGLVATGVTPTTAQSPQLQWYRCSRMGVAAIAMPSNCAPITNALALTYQMTAKDLRLFLRLAVTTNSNGVSTTVLSATSPRVIGAWLKVDTLSRGSTNNFGQFIGSPSKGVRNVKVLSGSCFVKNSTLIVRANATACQIKVTIAAKAPFPQLAFATTINTPT